MVIAADGRSGQFLSESPHLESCHAALADEC